MDTQIAETKIDRIESLIDAIKHHGRAVSLARSYQQRIGIELGLIHRKLAEAKSGILDASLDETPVSSRVAQHLADVANRLEEMANRIGMPLEVSR